MRMSSFFSPRSHLEARMKFFIMIAFLAILVTKPVAAGLILYNGHGYQLTNTKSNWNDSEAEAVSLRGHLITINDAAENQFVIDNFFVGQDPNRILWTGLTDRDSEGSFQWISGEPLTYTNWNPGEPNNAAPFGGPENYVVMNWHRVAGIPGDGGALGDWNDVALEGSVSAPWYSPNAVGPYYGLIEINLTAVPEPSTLLMAITSTVVGFGYYWRRGRVAGAVSSCPGPFGRSLDA